MALMDLSGLIELDKFVASFITEMKECRMRTFSIPRCIKKALNAHHFDYRGLIEKGLAIAVTAENNPYKE